MCLYINLYAFANVCRCRDAAVRAPPPACLQRSPVRISCPLDTTSSVSMPPIDGRIDPLFDCLDNLCEFRHNASHSGFKDVRGSAPPSRAPPPSYPSAPFPPLGKGARKKTRIIGILRCSRRTREDTSFRPPRRADITVRAGSHISIQLDDLWRHILTYPVSRHYIWPEPPSREAEGMT